jgi:hypothetical protein
MLVALAMLIVAVIASSLGVSWQAAIIMGGVVGMSSTAITLKQLSDDGELAGQHGRLARRAGPRSRADFLCCIECDPTPAKTSCSATPAAAGSCIGPG